MNNGRAGKLTERDIKAILSLHNREISQRVIAEKFKVDHSTIHYHLEKNGVVLRHRAIKPRGNQIPKGEQGVFVYQEYLRKDKERNKKMIIEVLKNPNARKCVDLDTGLYPI